MRPQRGDAPPGAGRTSGRRGRGRSRPPTCMPARTAAAAAVDQPRSSWRKRTMNPSVPLWPTISIPLPVASRQRRRSRSGGGAVDVQPVGRRGRRLPDPAPGGERRRPGRSARARAAPRAGPTWRRGAAARGPRCRRRGGPPSGGSRAPCRARARENQPITARPLAPVAAAPNMPATSSAAVERHEAVDERGHDERRRRPRRGRPPGPCAPRCGRRAIPTRSGSGRRPPRRCRRRCRPAGSVRPRSVRRVGRERRQPEAQRRDGGGRRRRRRGSPSGSGLAAALTRRSRTRSRWRRALAWLPQVCIEHQRRRAAGDRS